MRLGNETIGLVIFYLPLIRRIIVDFKFIKGANYGQLRGYPYAVLLPVIFVFMAYSTLDVFKSVLSDNKILIIGIVAAISANFLSAKFFDWRVDKQKIKENTESYIMSRFYQDLLYAMLLALPGLAFFFIF
ncbi:MAG: hypothetical protein V1905_01915 [bacterium]